MATVPITHETCLAVDYYDDMFFNTGFANKLNTQYVISAARGL